MSTRSAPNRDDTGRRAEAAITERLAGLPEVTRALVFGSRGRGDNAPRADVDLAVSCPGVDDRRWAEIEADIQEAETLLFLDVTRLEDAGGEFLDEILRTGRTIYERSPPRHHPGQPRIKSHRR
jgi:predicted nucleotidyltransferase